MGHMLINHHAEKSLQIDYNRRCIMCRYFLISDESMYCADNSHLISCFVKYMSRNMRCSRFSVRSRQSYHAHFPRRIIKEEWCHIFHCFPGIFYINNCDFIRYINRFLSNNCDGPLGSSFGCKIMPVYMGTAQADE